MQEVSLGPSTRDLDGILTDSYYMLLLSDVSIIVFHLPSAKKKM